MPETDPVGGDFSYRLAGQRSLYRLKAILKDVQRVFLASLALGTLLGVVVILLIGD